MDQVTPEGRQLAFIMGVPRSGTTLLSVMLGRHPGIHCPPEPWLLLALQSLGDVHPRHPAEANILGQAVEEFLGATRPEVVRRLAAAAYNAALEAHGKSWFVDKTPRYYLLDPAVDGLFPEAVVIVLQRNPLDVAASFKSTWGVDLPALLRANPGHPVCVDYLVGTRRVSALAAKFPETSLDYETMVADPAAALSRVLSPMGLEPAPGMTSFELEGSQWAGATMRDPKVVATSAAHTRSIGQWRSVFSREDAMLLFDALGAATFRDTGYGAMVEELLAEGFADNGSGRAEALLAEAEAAHRARLEAIRADTRVAAVDDPGSARSCAAASASPADLEVERLRTALFESHAQQQRLVDALTEAAAEIERLASGWRGAATELVEARTTPKPGRLPLSWLRRNRS